MIDVVVGDKDTGRTYSPSNLTQPERSPKAPIPGPPVPPVERRKSEKGTYRPHIFFAGAMLFYIILSILSLNEKYIDFGDGNYLYISWRASLGERLYLDMPNPQPPLHLFIGSFLLSLTGGEPWLVRLFQIALHCLTACCVWGISKRVFGGNAEASLGGIIYLFLPLGVWWATGYQSEPLLILLQSFNIMLLLDAMKHERPTRRLHAAALLMVLCCFTNMTALPYLLLQWFFIAYQFRPLLKAYSLTFLSASILFFIYMFFYTNGEYFYHVFTRQVGTYPSEPSMAIRYFLSKLYIEGSDVLNYEGGFVLCAIIGMFLFGGDQRTFKAKGYVLWWAIFSIGSIIFVTKGGTVDYIFTIGEPAVAVFSSYFLITLLYASTVPAEGESRSRMPLLAGRITLFVCLFIPAMLMRALVLLYMLFFNLSGPGGIYELSADEVIKTAVFIQRNCPEDQTVISPPYYAYMARRKIEQNACELFVVAHAYFNEWDALSKSRELDFTLPKLNEVYTTPFSTQSVYALAELFREEPELRVEYPTIALFLDLREGIFQGRVALILSNTTHLFFRAHPLEQAIRDFCAPTEYQLNLNNREERIVVYKPKLGM